MVTENVTIIVRERGAKATAAGIRTVGSASRGAAGAVRSLALALGGLAAVLSAKKMIQVADAATQIGNRIRISTDSFAEFVGVNRELIGISNRTRTSIKSNAELFQRFTVATRAIGASSQDVLDVTEGLTAAVAVSGKTAEEAGASLIQLSQGLASGRFAGDELRSVMEGLPEVGAALARELGVTTGALRDMGAEGKLNAQTVFPALLRASAEFVEELKQVNFTVDQTIQVFKNQFTVAVGAINNVLGATGTLNGAITTFSNNVGLGLVSAFARFAEITASAADAGAEVLQVLEEMDVVLPSLAETAGIVGGAFDLFFKGLTNGFIALRLLALSAIFSLQSAAQALGADRDEELAITTKQIEDASARLVDSSLKTKEAIDDLLKDFRKIATDGSVKGAADELRSFADKARDVAGALRELKTLGQIEDAFIGVTAKNAPSDEDIKKALTETGDDVTGVLSDLSKDIGDAFADSIGDGIKRAIAGEGFNAAQVLADISGGLVEAALEDAIQSFSDAIAGTFEGIATKLGAEAGGAFSAALAGAIGVGIGILARELSGTSATARNDLVRSATESAQATRGVVAGPTSIPVFQVGQQLEAALAGTNGILLDILGVLTNQPAAADGAGGGSAEAGSAAADLSLTTPSLV